MKIVKLFIFYSLIFAQTSLTQNDIFQNHKKEDHLRIGIASMMTPSDTMAYYLNLVDYIAKKINMKGIMIQRKTYQEMDLLLKRGEVDIAFICSGAYVQDKKDFGVELLAAEQHYLEGAFYRAYIITHKDNPINNFKELRGKTFAFTDPKSNTGYIFPMYLLLKMKEEPTNFFKKVYFTYSHNKSIHLVATKSIDAASVDSIVFDYLREKNEIYSRLIKIIEVSPKFGSPPVVASPKLSSDLKNKIREILLNMHLDKEGERILKKLHIIKFSTADEGAYKAIMEMIDSINKLLREVKFENIGGTNIKIGLLPNANARILYETYYPLIKYLKEQTPYTYELIIRPTYEDIIVDLGNGLIDLAFMDPLTYLEAKKRYNIRCLLKPLNKEGKPYYYSYIIARRDSAISSLHELKGHSFAFSSIKSAEGNLIPRLMLANSGIHLNDLSKYKNFNTGESAVKSIISDEYDGGAIKDSIIDRYLKGNIKIIAKSESIPTGPLAYRIGLPPDILNKIRDALLKLNYNNPSDRILMDKFNPDIRYGFVIAEDKDYEQVREQINNIPKKCGLGCHPKIIF